MLVAFTCIASVIYALPKGLCLLQYKSHILTQIMLERSVQQNTTQMFITIPKPFSAGKANL